MQFTVMQEIWVIKYIWLVIKPKNSTKWKRNCRSPVMRNISRRWGRVWNVHQVEYLMTIIWWQLTTSILTNISCITYSDFVYTSYMDPTVAERTFEELNRDKGHYAEKHLDGMRKHLMRKDPDFIKTPKFVLWNEKRNIRAVQN